MVEFCALRAKAYGYKLDDDTENKKAKGTKKCIVKREIAFNNYVDSLFKNDVLLKSQHRFRSDHHVVYTEEVNQIALSRKDDKRIQTPNKVTTYPYDSNAFMVCKNKMSKRKFMDSNTTWSDTLELKNDPETELDQKFRDLESLLHRDMQFTDDDDDESIK